jgi:hypothetical protein
LERRQCHRGRLFLPETNGGVNKGIANGRAAAGVSIFGLGHLAAITLLNHDHFARLPFARNRGYFWRSMLSEENHSPILGF